MVEYREILASPDLDNPSREECFNQYANILAALGREAELQEWESPAKDN